MQNRTPRLQVETFHVHQASIACSHQHRNPTGAGALAHDDLHVQRIAFVDNDVESVEELVDGVDCQPDLQNPDEEVWIEFGDSAGGHLGLVKSEVQYGRRQPVKIRQLDAIEIRQPKLAAQALRCQGMRDDMPDAQTNNTDAQRAKPGLLLGGDHAPVAVQPDRAKRPRSQHCHDGPPPRVVRPSAGFGNQLRIGWGPKPPQFLELFLAMVYYFDDGIGAQLLQYRIVGGVGGVENLSGTGSYGHHLGPQPRQRMRAQIVPPWPALQPKLLEHNALRRWLKAERQHEKPDAVILSVGPLGQDGREVLYRLSVLKNSASTGSSQSCFRRHGYRSLK